MSREVVDRNCVGGIWCASARVSGINFQACSFNPPKPHLSGPEPDPHWGDRAAVYTPEASGNKSSAPRRSLPRLHAVSLGSWCTHVAQTGQFLRGDETKIEAKIS